MKNITYLFLFISLFFISCQNETVELSAINNNPEYEFKSDDINNVGIDIAEIVAGKFITNPRSNDGKMKIPSFKRTLKSIFTVPDMNNEPSMYIINYEPTGYIIISATTKESPVLAYSYDNNFEVEQMPESLSEWIFERMDLIQYKRGDINYEIPNEVLYDWCSFLEEGEQKKALKSKIGPEIKNIQHSGINIGTMIPVSYGPYLQTKWGQGTPYNSYCPQLGCSDYINGRAPVGCSAVAIAQVLRYWEPYNSAGINWSALPNCLYSYDEFDKFDKLANLLYWIGTVIQMDYTCGGSYAWVNDGRSVFANFGFSNEYEYHEFSSTASGVDKLVQSQLSKGWPVILVGYNSFRIVETGWWIFKKEETVYEEGHAWVCDGFDRYFIDYMANLIRYEYYHMNWGWSSKNDGWFKWDDINIAGDNLNFQYNRHILYNIHL